MDFYMKSPDLYCWLKNFKILCEPNNTHAWAGCGLLPAPDLSVLSPSWKLPLQGASWPQNGLYSVAQFSGHLVTPEEGQVHSPGKGWEPGTAGGGASCEQDEG